MQLAPDDATVLNGCGHVLAGIGKLQEAIRLRERLLSIEPLYSVNTLKYAELLMATGRLDEAEKYLRTAEGLPPPKSSSLFQAMYLAILRGDTKAALEIAGAQPPSPWREMNLAVAAQPGTDRAGPDDHYFPRLEIRHGTSELALTVRQRSRFRRGESPPRGPACPGS